MTKHANTITKCGTIKSTGASNAALALYTPEQVYDIEKAWFAQPNSSYGLMEQAAWQMAYWLSHHAEASKSLRAWVWVGSGNNGGDGWLVAHYLTQLGAKVTVVEVANSKTEDAQRAKKTAQQSEIQILSLNDVSDHLTYLEADIFVDGLFGIGLDRAPEADYKQAINTINQIKKHRGEALTVVSIDVPSGLVAGTGQVFEACAIKADVSLCLVARKLGLHIKDGGDYSGQVVDIPLIPSVLSQAPKAWLYYKAATMPQRDNNSYKGSYGNALIIGGNRVDGSQGMGGAAILSASTAMATGLGKLTVACHDAFHASLITTLPNAMSIDLHDVEGVKEMITQCDTVAIGMGLGRDQKSLSLFNDYLQAAITAGLDIIIDADGLYHLATTAQQKPDLAEQLVQHANQHNVWYTPHSGEAARLLGVEVSEVESDRMRHIEQLAAQYQGSWLLKGAGSIIKEQESCYVCAAGNPGMATAGMGDVLSGLSLGLLAQSALPDAVRQLRQAVMVHALAGDLLQQEVGVWALNASDMPSAVGQVLKEITNPD